jgi:hypothetical protein
VYPQSLFEGKTLLSADLCFTPSFFYIAGNPSYGDDGPEICWNGAKSWETRWYAADSVDVVPSSTAPFTADLIGAADWSEGTYTPGNQKVVLRITDWSVTQKYHIMYNRAKGPNAGVTFAKDKVTVTLGASQQVSWHQAALGPVSPTNNLYPIFRKEKFNGGNKVSKQNLQERHLHDMTFAPFFHY